MSVPLNAPQIRQSVTAGTQRTIEACVQTLLEEKHLYQSIEVPLSKELAMLGKQANRDPFDKTVLYEGTKQFAGRWLFYLPDNPAPQSLPFGSPQFLALQIPFIKTFCTECGAEYPFNPVRVIDQLEPVPGVPAPLANRTGQTVQVFAFTYLCQGCRLLPEVFLVRRVGAKITLSGRAPIEHVAVPKFLPEIASKYVRDAIVAHQSGQTLSGLFQLRSAIEQWVYSLGAERTADKAIQWYMGTLPEDFRQHYPSLRKLYEDLSDALHKADGSATLFDSAKADIETHFDARRLRKLPEPQFK